jgi:hypothetical protein
MKLPLPHCLLTAHWFVGLANITSLQRSVSVSVSKLSLHQVLATAQVTLRLSARGHMEANTVATGSSGASSITASGSDSDSNSSTPVNLKARCWCIGVPQYLNQVMSKLVSSAVSFMCVAASRCNEFTPLASHHLLTYRLYHLIISS